MSTPDFFRSRLDAMIDLRHLLAELAMAQRKPTSRCGHVASSLSLPVRPKGGLGRRPRRLTRPSGRSAS
jgi:hypothetical protein